MNAPLITASHSSGASVEDDGLGTVIIGAEGERLLRLTYDQFAWLVTYPGPLIAGRIAEGKRRPIARRR